MHIHGYLLRLNGPFVISVTHRCTVVLPIPSSRAASLRFPPLRSKASKIASQVISRKVSTPAVLGLVMFNRFECDARKLHTAQNPQANPVCPSHHRDEFPQSIAHHMYSRVDHPSVWRAQSCRRIAEHEQVSHQK